MLALKLFLWAESFEYRISDIEFQISDFIIYNPHPVISIFYQPNPCCCRETVIAGLETFLWAESFEYRIPPKTGAPSDSRYFQIWILNFLIPHASFANLLISPGMSELKKIMSQVKTWCSSVSNLQVFNVF